MLPVTIRPSPVREQWKKTKGPKEEMNPASILKTPICAFCLGGRVCLCTGHSQTGDECMDTFHEEENCSRLVNVMYCPNQEIRVQMKVKIRSDTYHLWAHCVQEEQGCAFMDRVVMGWAGLIYVHGRVSRGLSTRDKHTRIPYPLSS